ncbi:MAG TPA: DUF4383 domain-containing protein [Gemmatimonadaceae bacterium]|nr:DUF4383 domain-containing protein [Gemmatimonadaceae bacterium]
MRFVQKMAGVFGLGFVVAAFLGFMLGGMSMDAHMASSTKLAGLFPVNAAHNALHLLLGAWGLLAVRSPVSARRYCLVSGALYLVLAGVGFVVPEVFGLMPIGGNDIALHAVFGMALTAIGALTTAEDESPATVRS